MFQRPLEASELGPAWARLFSGFSREQVTRIKLALRQQHTTFPVGPLSQIDVTISALSRDPTQTSLRHLSHVRIVGPEVLLFNARTPIVNTPNFLTLFTHQVVKESPLIAAFALKSTRTVGCVFEITASINCHLKPSTTNQDFVERHFLYRFHSDSFNALLDSYGLLFDLDLPLDHHSTVLR